MFPNDAAFCVSLTFDVEMCTNFPYWTCIWDHLKGAVDSGTKRYVGKLADIAEEAGVKFQWFVLGSSLEEEDLDYLRRLVAEGHALGNHTYRHVNVKAKTIEQLQVVYRNDPTLAKGFDMPLDVIRHEIQQTTALMQERLGITPRGLRTPGGFSNGLDDVPDVQQLIREEGFALSSSHYNYAVPRDRKPTWDELCDALRWSVINLQPYRYSNGLLEIPMMGISDIWAFRVLDLERGEWIQLLELGLDVACEQGLVFSILMHPQVLACRDPHAATVHRLLTKAQEKGGWVTTNDALADHFSLVHHWKPNANKCSRQEFADNPTAPMAPSGKPDGRP